jgi:hypothetical protein
LKGPGLRRIVAIKSALLVVLRRQRKLIWIQRPGELSLGNPPPVENIFVVVIMFSKPRPIGR